MTEPQAETLVRAFCEIHRIDLSVVPKATFPIRLEAEYGTFEWKGSFKRTQFVSVQSWVKAWNYCQGYKPTQKGFVPMAPTATLPTWPGANLMDYSMHQIRLNEGDPFLPFPTADISKSPLRPWLNLPKKSLLKRLFLPNNDKKKK